MYEIRSASRKIGQENRIVSNDNTVRYKSLVLQIAADKHRRHFVKAKVRVHEYPNGELAVFHGPRCIGKYAADGKPIEHSMQKHNVA